MKALAKIWNQGWTPMTALALLLFSSTALASPNPQTPFVGGNVPQFAQPLPLLNVQPGGTINTIVANNTTFAAPLELTMCEFDAKVLPPGTFAPGVQPLTRVWGYIPGTTCPTTPQDTYLGPVLVNIRNTPTTIRYTNRLPTVESYTDALGFHPGTQVLAYKYGTDQTLHWADPLNGEQNMCHMMSGDPPQVMIGIPTFGSECSLNFGESPRGTFNPVGIPAVPHLHGGEVPPVLDGGPDAWFTSFNANGTVEKGHDYYTNPNVPTAANQAVYSYPNTQQAAPIWFHDHTLGATRLNVYAGIAGGYYILDPVQEAYNQKINMRPVTEVIPIILQDRQFDVNGQLYFPTDFPGGVNGPTPNPQHPYWIPEFLGDVAVINGKAWPFLNVQPRRYRFLFLNGSNARTYEMFFVNPVTKVQGPVMWAIGNDGGFLDMPSIIDPNAAKPTEPHFIIMPGERYEIIVDFTNFAGQTLVLKNVAKAPYPAGGTVMGTNMGQLMQFRVSATPVADTSYNPASGIPLRPTPLVRLTNPATGTLAPGVTIAKTRELTLNEVALLTQTTTDPVTGAANTIYPGGPVEILVNNSLWAGKARADFTQVTVGGITEYISETPNEGDTELWEIVNTTMDAHPIHTHLATFQILNRQNYSAKGFTAAYAAAFPGEPAGALTGPCPKGVYCPAFGPPLNYNPSPASGNKYGGNPDVTPFLANAIVLPDPDEVGWKDTVMALPGMVTRIVVRFSPTETAAGTIAGYPFSPNDATPDPTLPAGATNSHGYVWHCHIIDHEDNEMMRPDIIIPLAITRSYVKGVNY